MTPAQFRQALSALGLSQVEAAEFLGVRSIRTVWSWANGRHPIPEAVAKLLHLMVDRQIAPAELEETVSIYFHR